ncbi:hypothetical protein OZ410_02870 [Robiginitalea sp. M366]|uniref:hypothetical protein n=1 Tax=Robiginitalea aestuariiviva TaxID=3036903 RepID=UPI00240D6401|nr:hypothetical protein [Robiginitalea aestuariiviva]MDG1571242.1 hypothetical protein [Robiginitalea aestuariiviva]
MKLLNTKAAALALLLLSTALPLLAQPEPGVYRATEFTDSATRQYLLMVSDRYILHTTYEEGPNHFLQTMGGFYTVEEDSLIIPLEFNSDFKTTGENTHRVSYGFVDGKLIFNGNESRPYTREPGLEQDLDGAWLFATRGPDTGQERRGDNTPRKTLKFLMDGYFQWIAYNTETMAFMGTGGGRYAAVDGAYTELIRFFSRDDSRVGAELNFEYERMGNDWHHKGKNSRGEPMYEIWSLRGSPVD